MADPSSHLSPNGGTTSSPPHGPLQYLAKETRTNIYTSTVSNRSEMLTGLALFLVFVATVAFVLARRRSR